MYAGTDCLGTSIMSPGPSGFFPVLQAILKTWKGTKNARQFDSEVIMTNIMYWP